jgi:glycosyltransferase involved in cell wall biosynthesis
MAIEPIIVAGLLQTRSGIGESARLCLQTLTAGGFEVAGIDLSGVLDQPCDQPFAGHDEDKRFGGGIVIVHMNAPLLPLSLCVLGKRFLKQKRIIGYWAWELPATPPDWGSGSRFVHEVWVPSNFTAEAVRPIATKPVYVVPHPLPPAAPRHRARSDYGLPEGTFLVGSMFDMRSGFARKNPLAAIAAFRQAFGQDRKKHLVLKVSHLNTASEQARQLQEAISGSTNISIQEQSLSREDLQGWISNLDVLISLHRAEGFGLVAAEAMQLGRPVIATNWSGNLDFMNSDNSALVSCGLTPAIDPQGIYHFPTQRWAEPDVAHAATWLTRLAAEPDLRGRLGRQAAVDIARLLSPSAYQARVKELLDRGPPKSA